MDFDDLNNSLELTQIAAKTVDVEDHKPTGIVHFCASHLQTGQIANLAREKSPTSVYKLEDWVPIKAGSPSHKSQASDQTDCHESCICGSKAVPVSAVDYVVYGKNHWIHDHNHARDIQRHPETRNPSIHGITMASP